MRVLAGFLLLCAVLAGCSSREPDKFPYSISACSLVDDATLAELARPVPLVSSNKERGELAVCRYSFRGEEMSHEFSISVTRFASDDDKSGAQKAAEWQRGQGFQESGWTDVYTDKAGWHGRDGNVVVVISHDVGVLVNAEFRKDLVRPTSAEIDSGLRLLAKEAHDKLMAQLENS